MKAYDALKAELEVIQQHIVEAVRRQSMKDQRA
jgi:hypothetical protein